MLARTLDPEEVERQARETAIATSKGLASLLAIARDFPQEWGEVDDADLPQDGLGGLLREARVRPAAQGQPGAQP